MRLDVYCKLLPWKILLLDDYAPFPDGQNEITLAMHIVGPHKAGMTNVPGHLIPTPTLRARKASRIQTPTPPPP